MRAAIVGDPLSAHAGAARLRARVMHGHCAARLSLRGSALPDDVFLSMAARCCDVAAKAFACHRACSIERAGQWAHCSDSFSLARLPPAAPLRGISH